VVKIRKSVQNLAIVDEYTLAGKLTEEVEYSLVPQPVVAVL
jgi:hypothetical protein